MRRQDTPSTFRVCFTDSWCPAMSVTLHFLKQVVSTSPHSERYILMQPINVNRTRPVKSIQLCCCFCLPKLVRLELDYFNVHTARFCQTINVFLFKLPRVVPLSRDYGLLKVSNCTFSSSFLLLRCSRRLQGVYPPHSPNDEAEGFVAATMEGAAVLKCVFCTGDRLGVLVGSNTGLLVIGVLGLG